MVMSETNDTYHMMVENTPTSSDVKSELKVTIQTADSVETQLVWDPEQKYYESKIPVHWRNGKLVQVFRDQWLPQKQNVPDLADFKSFNLKYVQNLNDMYVAMVSAPPQIKKVEATQYVQLSSRGRTHLDRQFDFIQSVELVQMPRDQHINITLCLKIFFPKNPDLYNQWLNSKSLLVDIIAGQPDNPQKCDWLYYPLVRVLDVSGPVSLTQPFPLFCRGEEQFSIQVDGIHDSHPRCLAVTGCLLGAQQLNIQSPQSLPKMLVEHA